MIKSEVFSIYVVLLYALFFSGHNSYAQIVPIINYSTDINNQAQLEVNSSTAKYYILKVKHHIDSTFNSPPVSMTLGTSGTTIIMESLEAYPLNFYQVLEYSILNPFDSDNDGIDDITEYNNMPVQNPINSANSINLNDGSVSIDNMNLFTELSVLEENLQWSPYLNGKQYLKFIIQDFNTDTPKIHFINTNTHDLHISFAAALNFDHLDPDVIKGHIIYHPTIISNNGTIGTFAFNFTNNLSEPFLTVQRTQELLASNMPFISNNLSYYINANNEIDYYSEELSFQNSRVSVVFESDIYAGVNYWGLHKAEGFGYFKVVNLNEIPGPKDIVLYQNVPNNLPRVAGIMTSFVQTPLSHVNLRAIQNDIPNAFVRDPLLIDTITSLLNHYIYYKVEQSGFTIREASLDEVNQWHNANRPKTTQFPLLNLDYKLILPLTSITFDMFDGFGAKVTNVATMKTFDLELQTIPDGFGVPFYYYHEFMKYNDFYTEIEDIISNEAFIANREVKDSLLSIFREKIKFGIMPTWMMTELSEMQHSFPNEASIRCRSSTNNEDLPNFSGAGLYDSKTHHPNEGHILKSIKQVYASLWNLRAFEEREYYRIDHFNTAMGVLCHLNYKDEKVNGVAVSQDPVYNTNNTYYLNSQLEDNLITNPVNNSPEELLINLTPINNNDYSVIQYSDLVGNDSLLLTNEQLQQLKDYITIIHNEFKVLYKAEENSTFAMDIEYKITNLNKLAIKQARPWVSYIPNETIVPISNSCKLSVFPNPAREYINITNPDFDLTSIKIVNQSGQIVLTKLVRNDNSSNIHIPIHTLMSGVYLVCGFNDKDFCTAEKLIIQ